MVMVILMIDSITKTDRQTDSRQGDTDRRTDRQASRKEGHTSRQADNV